MRAVRAIALATIALAFIASVAAPWIAPAHYETQDRDAADIGPSHHHLLGTDELGRDRFSRLIYAARISLLLAPLAAGAAVVLAAIIGGVAGCLGGWYERVTLAAIDVFLSLPWLFLLITVRAVMPLNTAPETSVMITFALMGLLGWAASARVVCAQVKDMMRSDFMLLARASGSGGARILLRQLVPNLKPVLAAQFLVSVPAFIVTEANLGALGLGVSEPLPSLGGMLRELQNYIAFQPPAWRFVPLAFLVLVVTSFQLLLTKTEVRS
jgi:ABC-type dipeptide/oligopeptide/nickel transport system permease subunit